MEGSIHIATIVASRGNRGEVAAICPSGHPERLEGLLAAVLEARDGSRRQVRLRRAWAHRGRLVVHLEGVDSIGEAETLVGSRLYVAEADLPGLPAGGFYTFRAVGARVVDTAGRTLGRVVDTQEGPAQDLLVVERAGGGEALVPLIDAIVKKIDLEAGVVVVDAPEGLLEGEPVVAGDGQ